jgi:hypothetical protein
MKDPDPDLFLQIREAQKLADPTVPDPEHQRKYLYERKKMYGAVCVDIGQI